MKLKGNKVVDATKDLVLIVMQKDVDFASRKKNHSCAVAKACARQEKMEALIHLTRVYLRNGEEHWTRYILPPSLRGELIAFDRGGTFIPDTYVLLAPKKSEKLGSHAGGKRGKDNPNSLRKKPTYVKDIRANVYNVTK
tara:strand:- start:125 stop:541 length:417 start_codon:yes stop_codon:yes gene_type:complete